MKLVGGSMMKLWTHISRLKKLVYTPFKIFAVIFPSNFVSYNFLGGWLLLFSCYDSFYSQSCRFEVVTI